MKSWTFWLLQEVTVYMLNKLALRNARRSMRDYLVYLITMTAVAAMMFAFNSLIFSEDI